MGLASGAMSMTRYKVLGLAKPSLTDLNKGILPFKAKPLSVEGNHNPELAYWVLPNLPDLDREGDYWDMSDCLVEGGYALRIRIEKRSVPSELLKSLHKEELQALAKKLERRPNRVESRQVKDRLKEELMTKALPTIRFIDLFWSEETNEVTVFTTSKNSCAFFEQLFRKSILTPLGGELVCLMPPLFGLDEKDWKGHSQRAESIGRLVPAALADLTF